MRAAQFTLGTGFEIVDMELPALGPDEVLLRVLACGVCGSDRQLTQGESVPTGTVFPLVMGHEIAGEILQVGTDVREWHEGAHVVVHPFIACNTCAPCQHNQPNLCVRQTCIGYQQPGGFAEQVIVPASQLAVIPEDVSPPTAALLVDAFATPYHAMQRAGVGPDQTVLIIGTGGLGLAALQLARTLGVAKAGVVTRRRAPNPDTAGFAVAGTPGTAGLDAADVVVSMADEARAVGRALRRWSGAKGIDVVIDTIANQATVALALDVVRSGGTIALVGMSDESAEFPIAKTVRRGIRVVASYGSVMADVQQLLAFAQAHKLHPAALIAETLPLADVARAFSGARASGRFVIMPNG